MGAGTLTIYNASAGSGKTFRLAGAYLDRLFRFRFSYAKILAVTFTNKATAEMKSRILDELNNLALGKESDYLPDLLKSSGKSEESIRKEAKDILFSILHDYSRFYVSTIDSFFQKILRAFARDIGLHSGFEIELDQTRILNAAVEKVILSASSEAAVRKWLSDYARANIEDEKTWDLKKSILTLSKELFSEKFKLLSSEEKNRLLDKNFLNSYIKEMKKISSDFKKEMIDLGNKCLTIYSQFSLSDDMFYQKGKGIPGFIRSVAEGNIIRPNDYVREIENNPPRWSKDSLSRQLQDAISSGLEETLKRSVHYYDDNIRRFNSANIILSNIYNLGILSDILKQIQLITKEEDIFLLSDTGELIFLITDKDQTPFIYEKVGNIFENYMIDEFQDTSIIQWKNFKILIDNSMAQGGDNLVVGDIKQSIYRWRNSDWHTLGELRRSADNIRFKSEPLNTNWRSCANIIRFNNSLFSIIPFQIDMLESGQNPPVIFRELFSEAVQNDPGFREEGFIRIEFVENSDEASWNDLVIQRLPSVIESIQDKGYRTTDIGILVRNNKEGAQVLKRIIDYSSTCSEAEKNRYDFNIVSNDSLLLINSPAVNFLIAVLSVLDNPDDMIGRALMLRYFLLATGKADAEKVPLEAASLIRSSSGFFPSGYEEFLDSVRNLTMWDITEKTIKFFNLGDYPFNVSYLNSFQDIIINYTSNKNSGISSFLEWWDSDGTNKSISLPEQQDAIRVMTIHKSKGLEFNIVILPFISWNLDHKAFHTNILWVKPDSEPFNMAGIVPVRYKKDLSESIFFNQYNEEKYSAFTDNLNLLYVAMTRARTAIFGFAPAQPRQENKIAGILKDAINFRDVAAGVPDIFLYHYFDQAANVFEFGSYPVKKVFKTEQNIRKIESYQVNDNMEALKLKLHWEDYFIDNRSGKAKQLNYGRLMHEVFEEIITVDDVYPAVRRKVIEGQIPEADENDLREKIVMLINKPVIIDWFAENNEVLNEASILMPRGNSKRPDRIILRDGKAIIVDFKFGEEDPHYLSQIKQYKKIMEEMGYNQVEAHLWYVDADKIVSV